MSGGSWDYVYGDIQEAADRLMHEPQPLRVALGMELEKFVHALHEIEWVDSCDKSHPDDENAIREALGEKATALELQVLIKRAEEVLSDLDYSVFQAKIFSK